MAQIPDLIRDSKLETRFLPHCGVETVHTFRESDPASGQRLVIRSEHWQRQRRIGSGGFGSVWLERRIKGGRSGATAAQDSAVRAVKQIDMDTRLGLIHCNHELEAIAKFSHSRYEHCFVKSFGWYEGPGQLFIAMEYLEMGDLFMYLCQKPSLPEAEAKDITYQILDGLNMMHENGFAHRDLKPNNVLIKSCPPAKWWIKLADFGITKRIEEGSNPLTRKGTPRYCAPELWGFIEPGSAYAADIWALGEILFEMLTKKPAFAYPGLLADYKTQQQFPVTKLRDAGISQQGIDFLLSLMCLHPNDRITASSALSNVWIQPLIPQNPTTAVQGESEIPYPKTTLLEDFASWTTKLSLETPKAVIHDMPGSTTTPEAVYGSQGKATTAQGEKPATSSGTTNPQSILYQVETLGPSPLEPSPIELEKWHWKGVSLIIWGQKTESETMFRQTFEGREKVLGKHHRDTLDSVHWLGVCLCSLNRYKEAETMFRQALQGREKVLGKDDKDTLDSAQWLGVYLFSQNWYKEAESMFRQAVQGQEKVWGYHHENALDSVHWLGVCLHSQNRYKEAEHMFRQALRGREKVFGYDQKNTLNPSQWLSQIAYNQRRYEEAETLFQQALLVRGKVLGKDHMDTLDSVHWLGVCLHDQHRFEEAKTMLRRALQGREKLLGYNHEDTRRSRLYLDAAQSGPRKP
ncbi:hypothetical protein PEBR_18436 [Penicillium brasilianum]|uniref:Protein kinase domain-containing protein n=1 Tax=Penicillium brasilianum TaxID=104259 RepID=A0A1S9RPD6_PENBI|nr:hypothetical protein PEBR_18436 [Penicillium brasilianum]